jgi:serine/threonine protein kinase
MPLIKLPFIPGIDKQDTEYGAEGKWSNCDNVRFRYGLPEKIGGWAKVTSDALVGATRGIRAWFSLDGDPYTIIGTNKKLYVYANNDWSDITPNRSTGDSITQFATTANSTTVSVTDAGHGAVEGDFVTISSATPPTSSSLSAANLQGEFEIQTVTSTSVYTIVAGGTEGGADRTGGSATAAYEINTKPATSIQGYGWGAGTWGLSTWGTSRSGLAAPNSVQLDSGKWSIDNWGEDSLCQFLNGSLYYWDTSSGASTIASVVSNAPTTSRFVLVSGTDRHVICFGTETTIADATTQDDMFIRWSTQDDHTTWLPTATNTAGTQRLTDGSRLTAAIRSRGAVLIWSDTALYQMQLIGAPFTFGFSQLGSACGAVGLHAVVETNGNTFWMGIDSFFMFDGSVQKIPCSVEDYVFKDIDEASQKDTFAALNSEFNEVTWFYPSDGSNVIDRCVTYNYQERVWSIGTLSRTSWADKGVYKFPYATSYSATDTTSTISTINGLTAGRTFMYSQENGNNDDGSAMTASLESGDFVIPQAGERLMSVKRFIPDFKNQSGDLSVEFNFKLYPASTAVTKGPYTVGTSTTKIDTRARGRQCSLKIESSALNTTWRYGTFRADIQPDGMR